MKAALDHLHDAIAQHYGHAGKRFVTKLAHAANRDEKRLRKLIAEKLAKFDKLATSNLEPSTYKRHLTAFGVIYAAGSLAQEAGILPKAWGSVGDAILKVMMAYAGSIPATASERVEAYAKANWPGLRKLRPGRRSLPASKFPTHPGAIHKGPHGRELLVPTQVFQGAFPDHRRLLQELHKAGLLRSEPNKLTIKSPKAYCDHGRVYAIRLP